MRGGGLAACLVAATLAASVAGRDPDTVCPTGIAPGTPACGGSNCGYCNAANEVCFLCSENTGARCGGGTAKAHYCAPGLPCAGWCGTHADAWQTKCKFGGCSGCGQCAAGTTPAPTSAATSGPAASPATPALPTAPPRSALPTGAPPAPFAGSTTRAEGKVRGSVQLPAATNAPVQQGSASASSTPGGAVKQAPAGAASCTALACASGSARVANSAAVKCPGGQCTDALCCRPLTAAGCEVAGCAAADDDDDVVVPPVLWIIPVAAVACCGALALAALSSRRQKDASGTPKPPAVQTVRDGDVPPRAATHGTGAGGKADGVPPQAGVTAAAPNPLPVAAAAGQQQGTAATHTYTRVEDAYNYAYAHVEETAGANPYDHAEPTRTYGHIDDPYQYAHLERGPGSSGLQQRLPKQSFVLAPDAAGGTPSPRQKSVRRVNPVFVNSTRTHTRAVTADARASSGPSGPDAGDRSLARQPTDWGPAGPGDDDDDTYGSFFLAAFAGGADQPGHIHSHPPRSASAMPAPPHHYEHWPAVATDTASAGNSGNGGNEGYAQTQFGTGSVLSEAPVGANNAQSLERENVYMADTDTAGPGAACDAVAHSHGDVPAAQVLDLARRAIGVEQEPARVTGLLVDDSGQGSHLRLALPPGSGGTRGISGIGYEATPPAGPAAPSNTGRDPDGGGEVLRRPVSSGLGRRAHADSGRSGADAEAEAECRHATLCAVASNINVTASALPGAAASSPRASFEARPLRKKSFV